MQTYNDEFLFEQKYRPKTLEDCILPSAVKKQLKPFLEKKEIPNMLFYGGAGTGKTTLALVVCQEIGAETLFINASKDRSIDIIRGRVTNFCSTSSITGESNHKVVIFDEADSMTKDCQTALRAFIEEFSSMARFIFSCNYVNQLIDPLQNRCSLKINYRFKKSDREKMTIEFYKRTIKILKEEQIDYDESVVASLVQKFAPSWREVLGAIQIYSSTGILDKSCLEGIGEKTDVEILVKDILLKKKFSKMIDWVEENPDVDFASLVSDLYENIEEYFSPESRPEIISILGMYNSWHNNVVNPTINLCAMLTEVMGVAKAKDE